MAKTEFCKKCGFNVAMHKAVKYKKGLVCPPISMAAPMSAGEAAAALAADSQFIQEVPGEFVARANDRQVGVEDHAGGGYGADGAIQHWDYAVSHRFDYFQGQITKYITRWKKKGGLKDLQKAAHFLDKYMECHERFKDL